MKRKLQFDRALMTDMLGDPEFYAECPIFLFMRDMGIESYKLYIERLESNECENCSDRSVMLTALTTFIRHIREQADLSKDNLACVKDYLAKRKGYYPDPCVVYYKESGGTVSPIEF
tara:strand:+ start:1448 stop:1798 length:351 start_codon:yes stop_codon:yes gene_type:complete